MENTSTAKEEFLKFVNYLKKSYKTWYTRNVNRSLGIWYACQILSVLCGFATGLLAAFSNEKSFIDTKIWLVIIPLIGSLSATVILQFRIYDLWQLRENGRIAIEKMISTGFQLYASNKTEEEYSALHKEFIEQIYKIEEEQKTQFFNMSSANSIMKFDKSKTSM